MDLSIANIFGQNIKKDDDKKNPLLWSSSQGYQGLEIE